MWLPFAARFICTFGWDWSAEIAGEKAAGGLASLRRFTADLEAAQLNADELGEIPDDFLDPITMELMTVRPLNSSYIWAGAVVQLTRVHCCVARRIR